MADMQKIWGTMGTLDVAQPTPAPVAESVEPLVTGRPGAGPKYGWLAATLILGVILVFEYLRKNEEDRITI